MFVPESVLIQKDKDADQECSKYEGETGSKAESHIQSEHTDTVQAAGVQEQSSPDNQGCIINVSLQFLLFQEGAGDVTCSTSS